MILMYETLKNKDSMSALRARCALRSAAGCFAPGGLRAISSLAGMFFLGRELINLPAAHAAREDS
jgi:hypothetical protein